MVVVDDLVNGWLNCWFIQWVKQLVFLNGWVD